MDFWNHKVNVSKQAAQQQIDIINTFPPEKRMKIALNFANLGIQQTRAWIKRSNPYFSDLEIKLEFVRLMYFKTGQMPEENWLFFKSKMEEKIKKDWTRRFRKMMQDNNWTYENIAKIGNFKSVNIIKSTISRGLPSFAKLAVLVHENNST